MRSILSACSGTQGTQHTMADLEASASSELGSMEEYCSYPAGPVFVHARPATRHTVGLRCTYRRASIQGVMLKSAWGIGSSCGEPIRCDIRGPNRQNCACPRSSSLSGHVKQEPGPCCSRGRIVAAKTLTVGGPTESSSPLVDTGGR